MNLLAWLVVISALEWGIHKHIMHGDPEVLKTIPLMGGWLGQTAQTHNDHHLDVDNDMRIPDHVDIEGLYFSWGSTVPMFAAATAIMLVVNRLLKGPGTVRTIQTGAFLAVIFSLVWNSVHTRMHEYELRVTLVDGVPSIEGFPTGMGWLYDWMWRNHALHHMQKGSKKGNYNIIVPGFDFLMGTHTDRMYDNQEYCKHSDDKRCMEKKASVELLTTWKFCDKSWFILSIMVYDHFENVPTEHAKWA